MQIYCDYALIVRANGLVNDHFGYLCALIYVCVASNSCLEIFGLLFVEGVWSYDTFLNLNLVQCLNFQLHTTMHLLMGFWLFNTMLPFVFITYASIKVSDTVSMIETFECWTYLILEWNVKYRLQHAEISDQIYEDSNEAQSFELMMKVGDLIYLWTV